MCLKALGDHLSNTQRVLATIWEMHKSIGDPFSKAYGVVDTLWEMPR
jgi:hypothetical protein